MPRDLKHLYVVVKDDEVIFHATNLSKFIEGVKKIDAIKSKIKSHSTMQRYFTKSSRMTYLGVDRKIYHLQKVL